ncbi:hypothetical protein B296_00014051 [Ensete ventricosum]|uniref:Uncharacterized protein n=1 Tax=Ensete ventricosum TaxID=4639 RepID=A0A426ZQW6_ENSVE|nr:hypothetical protein B296_00014051 [Ensete ventricosum]
MAVVCLSTDVRTKHRLSGRWRQAKKKKKKASIGGWNRGGSDPTGSRKKNRWRRTCHVVFVGFGNLPPTSPPETRVDAGHHAPHRHFPNPHGRQPPPAAPGHHWCPSRPSPDTPGPISASLSPPPPALRPTLLPFPPTRSVVVH